jgi:hypothetical protein
MTFVRVHFMPTQIAACGCWATRRQIRKSTQPQSHSLLFSSNDTESPATRMGTGSVGNPDDCSRVLLLGCGIRTAWAASSAVDGRPQEHRRVLDRCVLDLLMDHSSSGRNMGNQLARCDCDGSPAENETAQRVVAWLRRRPRCVRLADSTFSGLVAGQRDHVVRRLRA